MGTAAGKRAGDFLLQVLCLDHFEQTNDDEINQISNAGARTVVASCVRVELL